VTPAALRQCLELLRWPPSALAVLCGYSRQSGTGWAAGSRPIPAPVAAWLALLAAFHERHPPPRRP